MKKFITITLLSLIAVVSCKKFDDSKIWDKLNDHENRILLLEELCRKLNADIINLQTIVTALETNDYIINASPLATGDGYTFLFKSGKSIVVYNGKDGSDGKDGVTPQISIKKDTDGVYYWTINGEWLIVDGEKVKARAEDGTNGNNGITPQLKIEEDYWYISYDSGKTWDVLGKASTSSGLDGILDQNGDSVFSKVSQDDKCVYFYLSDGSIITLYKHDANTIQFEDLNVKAICCKNWDTNLDGELSYEEAAAVEEIDSNSGFSSNDNIIAFTELKYFSNLISIGSYAFRNCTLLWKIEFPESLEEIGSRAFDSCKCLSYINIPKNVKKIDSYAFNECQNIKSIVIESKVWTECDPDAFFRCGGKAYINGDIPSNAFNNSYLTEVVISDQVAAIGDSAFSSNGRLVTLTIGNNVQTIGDYAFAACNITEVVIPDSVTTIGSKAFRYCDELTSVIIGTGIKTIGAEAFMTNNFSQNILTSVRISSATPPTIGTHALYVHSYVNSYNTHYYQVPTNMTIYVPNASLWSYKSKWSNFTNNIVGF